MGVGLFHENNSVFSIYCKYSKIDLYATVINSLRLYKSFLQINVLVVVFYQHHQ